MNTNRYCERLAIQRPAVEHFIGRHDTSLLRLIVLALLEHGGPLSMEEIADRLLDAGVRAPSGDMVRSLRKAWHGLPPVIKEPDGTMGLDLESWELKHLAWELGRETKPAAEAAPAPPAAEMPGDDAARGGGPGRARERAAPVERAHGGGSARPSRRFGGVREDQGDGGAAGRQGMAAPSSIRAQPPLQRVERRSPQARRTERVADAAARGAGGRAVGPGGEGTRGATSTRKGRRAAGPRGTAQT